MLSPAHRRAKVCRGEDRFSAVLMLGPGSMSGQLSEARGTSRSARRSPARPVRPLRARPIESSACSPVRYGGGSAMPASSRPARAGRTSSVMPARSRCCVRWCRRRSLATCSATVRPKRRHPTSSSPPRISGPSHSTCRDRRCGHDDMARSRTAVDRTLSGGRALARAARTAAPITSRRFIASRTSPSATPNSARTCWWLGCGHRPTIGRRRRGCTVPALSTGSLIT